MKVHGGIRREDMTRVARDLRSGEQGAKNRGGFFECMRWACAGSEREASDQSRRIPPSPPRGIHLVFFQITG